jgi:hypothetical protein
MLRIFQIFTFAFVSVILLHTGNARAFQPNSLMSLALSEMYPFVIAPFPLKEEEFSLHWKGEPLEGVNFQLAQGSLEWVRVADDYVLPRGILKIDAERLESGIVRSGGRVQAFPLVSEEQKSSISVPLVLLKGESSAIEVSLLRNGILETGFLEISFSPKKTDSKTSYFHSDLSCSPYVLRVEELRPLESEWAHIACRLVSLKHGSTSQAYLELSVLWSQNEETLEFNGIAAPSASEHVWNYRLAADSGTVELASKSSSVRIHYAIPKKTNRAFLGLGVGPYQYTYKGGKGGDVETIAPLLTFYASYTFSQKFRIVAFDALPLHRSFFNDLGVYLWKEQFRAFDQRLSMNLLLGAHLVVFQGPKNIRVELSAPQGVEFIYRDFINKRFNLGIGGFYYPLVQGRTYYNFWVRWGRGAHFLEVNYISWREPVSSQNRVFSESLGLTVGFPLIRFL